MQRNLSLSNIKHGQWSEYVSQINPFLSKLLLVMVFILATESKLGRVGMNFCGVLHISDFKDTVTRQKSWELKTLKWNQHLPPVTRLMFKQYLLFIPLERQWCVMFMRWLGHRPVGRRFMPWDCCEHFTKHFSGTDCLWWVDNYLSNFWFYSLQSWGGACLLSGTLQSSDFLFG